MGSAGKGAKPKPRHGTGGLIASPLFSVEWAWLANLAKRMECAQLAAALNRPNPSDRPPAFIAQGRFDSGSNLRALPRKLSGLARQPKRARIPSRLGGRVPLSAAAFIAVSATACWPASELGGVKSSDGLIEFKVFGGPGKDVRYSVTFRKQPVIEPSEMRFSVDGVALTSDVEFGEVKRYELNQTYPWRGVHSLATNHYKGATISLKHRPSRASFALEVRAFDNGVAFRCTVPGGEKERVPDEADTFRIPAGSTVWYHGLEGHYEGVHVKKRVEEIPAGQWLAPPVTFKLPHDSGYASITEAALVNFSGMALEADGHGGFVLGLAHRQPVSYPFKLRYSQEDIERLSKPAAVSGTITSPWRVIMIGRDLNALVNCDIVPDLCPPPDPKLFPEGIRTAWLKPGRAVWKYMDGGESTLEGTKEFCQGAGELGFEYNVVEGYWSRWSDEEIKELVRYARQRRVGLWFWKHSRRLRTPEEREEFFKKLENLGVAGAKIDFFDHEHKEIIDLYQALLKSAAEHKILVDFHGSNKPTGESRTWPNEMVREAIRGMESSKLADRATHDVTLPFTRYLAGHADYTVMHFGERRGNTTWAHQMACAAVFTAPLLTYVANPTNILRNPAVEMIKSIPSVWDETVVLPPSEIGEVAAFARRKGGRWFLAVLNGPAARSVRIPLSFLGRGGWQAMFVRDAKGNPASVKMEDAAAKAGDSLLVELSSGGGFIGRFSRDSSSSSSSFSFPRVFLLDPNYLQMTRQRTRAGDRTLAEALDRLERDANEALRSEPFSVVQKKAVPPSGDRHDYMSEAPYYWPNPSTSNGLPYVRRDGERNPEINRISDHRNLGEMPDKVETLALAYYFTGQERYAAKAAELLRVWFLAPETRMNPNLQYAQAVLGLNTGRGTGLIESRGLARVVDAIGLLAGSKAWTAADQRGMEEWFARFLQWMLESEHGRAEAAAKNNHGTYYDMQAASFALFLGQNDLATNILKTAREKRIAAQIEPDGRQPLELVRTKAWSYSVGNLAGLMSLATLGERVGVDLWNYRTADGRSIRAALDFLTPFALGECPWPYQQLGGWPPGMLYPLLRRAAAKYPDQAYLAGLAKIPAGSGWERSELLRPKPADQPEVHE